MTDAWGGAWGSTWKRAWGAAIPEIAATDVELPLPVDVQLWKVPPGYPGERIFENVPGVAGKARLSSPGGRMQRGETTVTVRTGTLGSVRE